MNLTISAYSTALFSTWINVEELNLLVDAGDGVVAGLLSKSRKIKHVFLTHPDRDHITGLLQFNQLNSREGFPKIYYPKDSGSFPALQNFQLKFDPHIKSTEWYGIQDKSEIGIKKGFYVQAIRNGHIMAPKNVFKSLSYKVFETKQKLKPEFSNLKGQEIQKIASTKGKSFLTYTTKKNIISFSGDTPVDNYEKWNNSEILIHEATFINQNNESAIESRGNKHSYLEDVIKMVSEIYIEKLILNHFSSRYSKEQIDLEVIKLCKKYRLEIPVYIIYPGEIKRDILKSVPINQ